MTKVGRISGRRGNEEMRGNLYYQIGGVLFYGMPTYLVLIVSGFTPIQL